MLKIRKEQMEAFEKSSLEPLVHRAMEQVRSKYPDRLPESDTELRESVTGWITDARRWGFNADPEILRYVDFCAKMQGRRESLETRLKTYLQLYHENLLSKVDLDAFVRAIMQLASRHNVCEEEGITWLAVILLAGRRKGDPDQNWIMPILDQSSLAEEARVLQVHQQAIARGWIASQRVP